MRNNVITIEYGTFEEEDIEHYRERIIEYLQNNYSYEDFSSKDLYDIIYEIEDYFNFTDDLAISVHDEYLDLEGRCEDDIYEKIYDVQRDTLSALEVGIKQIIEDYMKTFPKKIEVE